MSAMNRHGRRRKRSVTLWSENAAARTTHPAHNNEVLLHPERTSDKPHQCAETRHLPRLQTLFRVRTLIVGQAGKEGEGSEKYYCVRCGVSTRSRRPYAVFGPDCPRARRRARERCDRGRIRFLSGSPRPPKNASFSHNSLIAYRRTWLKIIAWAAAKASSSKPSQ
jgi:hypothetical protein